MKGCLVTMTNDWTKTELERLVDIAIHKLHVWMNLPAQHTYKTPISMIHGIAATVAPKDATKILRLLTNNIQLVFKDTESYVQGKYSTIYTMGTALLREHIFELLWAEYLKIRGTEIIG